jgi:hypothetical protein
MGAGLTAAAWAASAATGFTAWLVLQESPAGAPPRAAAEADLVAPLAGLDLDSGEWSAYLLLDLADFRELRGELRWNCLKLTDRDELKQIQQQLRAPATGADVATVTSRFVLLRDGKLAFDAGLSLRGRDLDGLQTPASGWLSVRGTAVASRFADRFRPVCWPLVVL